MIFLNISSISWSENEPCSDGVHPFLLLPSLSQASFATFLQTLLLRSTKQGPQQKLPFPPLFFFHPPPMASSEEQGRTGCGSSGRKFREESGKIAGRTFPNRENASKSRISGIGKGESATNIGSTLPWTLSRASVRGVFRDRQLFGKGQKGFHKRGIHDQGDFWKNLLETTVQTCHKIRQIWPFYGHPSLWIPLLALLELQPSRVFLIRADFREGDEGSDLSVFRVRRFSEWPEPLHWIAFPVEILTKPLIHWIASPFFSLKNPFFHWKKCFVAPPSTEKLARSEDSVPGHQDSTSNLLFPLPSP